MERSPICTNCAYEYQANDQPPCPRCGHTTRKYFETLEVVARALPSLQEVGTRASGFNFFKGLSRFKKAGKTGNLADETLSIDRSDPDKTVKRHVVREEQPDGTWTTEHDERVEYPAKRRASTGD